MQEFHVRELAVPDDSLHLHVAIVDIDGRTGVRTVLVLTRALRLRGSLGLSCSLGLCSGLLLRMGFRGGLLLCL